MSYGKIVTSFIVLLIMSMPNGLAMHVGDFEITPKVSVTQSYDDNITYVATNEKSDWRLSPKFQLDALLEGKLRLLKLSGGIDRNIYYDNGDFDNTSENFDVNFMQELSKLDRIIILNSFDHTYEPRSFEDAFGRTLGRYGYYRNDFIFNYNRDLSKQMNVNVRYSNQINNISRSNSSDSYLNQVGARFTYYASSALVFFFTENFFYRTFHPGQDSYTNRVLAGIRKFFTKQLYIDAQVGPDFIRSFNDESYIRPYTEISIVDDLDEVTQIRIFFAREYQTNAYTQDLFDSWRIGGSVSRQFTKRLAADANVFYGHGEYLSIGREEDLWGGSLGMSYDLNRYWKGSLRYSHSTQDSNFSGSEYDKNVISIGVSAQF